MFEKKSKLEQYLTKFGTYHAHVTKLCYIMSYNGYYSKKELTETPMQSHKKSCQRKFSGSTFKSVKQLLQPKDLNHKSNLKLQKKFKFKIIASLVNLNCPVGASCSSHTHTVLVLVGK